MTEETNIPTVPQAAPVERNWFDRAVINIGNIVAFLYIITVFVTVYEVFMRYVLGAPTIWGLETTILLVGSAMLYGGCYCMANDGHIRVTIIRDIMPPALRRINDIIVAFLTFLFTSSLCYAGYIMASKAFFTPDGVFRMEGSGSAWNSPMPALIKAVLLFCVILMTIQALMQFISIVVKGDKSHA